MRLDEFVSKKLSISRSKAKRLINLGFVVVNEELKKPSYKVKSGDFVKIEEFKESIYVESKIIYEDDEIFVIDKQLEDVYKIAEFYKHKVIDATNNGLVHRLDKFTTGVMIFAKTLEVQKFLKNEFKNRDVKKTYIAITESGYDKKMGIIKAKIYNYKGRTSILPFGKDSLSKFKVLIEKNGVAVVFVEPITGRTHQVRAHLSFIGKPICGDYKYGSKIVAPRYMLHSYKIVFNTPTKKHSFIVSPPKDFEDFLKNYGISNLRLLL